MDPAIFQSLALCGSIPSANLDYDHIRCRQRCHDRTVQVQLGVWRHTDVSILGGEKCAMCIVLSDLAPEKQTPIGHRVDDVRRFGRRRQSKQLSSRVLSDLVMENTEISVVHDVWFRGAPGNPYLLDLNIPKFK